MSSADIPPHVRRYASHGKEFVPCTSPCTKAAAWCKCASVFSALTRGPFKPCYDFSDRELIEIANGNDLEKMLETFAAIASDEDRCTQFIISILRASFLSNRLRVAALFFKQTYAEFPHYFEYFRILVCRALEIDEVVKNVFESNCFTVNSIFTADFDPFPFKNVFVLCLRVVQYEVIKRNRVDPVAYPFDHSAYVTKDGVSSSGYEDVCLEWDVSNARIVLRTDNPVRNRIFEECMNAAPGADPTVDKYVTNIRNENKRFAFMQKNGMDISKILLNFEIFFLAELHLMKTIPSMMNTRARISPVLFTTSLIYPFSRLYQNGFRGDARYFVPVMSEGLRQCDASVYTDLMNKMLTVALINKDFDLTLFIFSRIAKCYHNMFSVFLFNELLRTLSAFNFGKENAVTEAGYEAYISSLATSTVVSIPDHASVFERMSRLGVPAYVDALLKSPLFGSA
jgi:hypothetical protein